MSNNSFPALVDKIVVGMEDRKAEKIAVFNLSEIDNRICDYFVICEGTSNTQVKAIADRVEEIIREDLQEKPWHVEGKESAEWVLLDYVDTVAHVFQKETRDFYDLEGLWGDAQITEIDSE